MYRSATEHVHFPSPSFFGRIVRHAEALCGLLNLSTGAVRCSASGAVHASSTEYIYIYIFAKLDRQGVSNAMQVPVGLPEEAPLSSMTAVAYDGMRVPLIMLPDLPRIMPAIAAALGDNDSAVR